jgi:hypothetical protein
MLHLLLSYNYIREYIESNQNDILTNLFIVAAESNSLNMLDVLLNYFEVPENAYERFIDILHTDTFLTFFDRIRDIVLWD